MNLQTIDGVNYQGHS